eukprot:s5186_g4.t1
MADDGGNVDANDEENENRDWSTCRIGIETVHKISIGKRRWFPPSQEHDGRTYITLSKSDAGLVLLVTGKGQNRHLVRNDACTALLRQHMMAAVKGDEPAPRFRQAREDDRFLIAKDLEVNLPPSDGVEFEGISCRMLWSVKSKDLQVELTETNLRYIFAALECSDPIEKKEKAPPTDGDQAVPHPGGNEDSKRGRAMMGMEKMTIDMQRSRNKKTPCDWRRKWYKAFVSFS